MRIRHLLDAVRAKNQTAFIPYLTVGDPHLAVTEELVLGLVEAGADIIELGVPFSDPIADGPVNQRSHERALKNHTTLKECCGLVEKLRRNGCTVPIVLFSYFNPILRMGLEPFATLAARSGVDAVLIVDLPGEEAGPLLGMLERKGLGIVLLASPTTSHARIQRLSAQSPEFIYYIARKGVTGLQKAMPTTLSAEIAMMRQITDVPIAVGFGISTPKQARMVGGIADAVIIGSALVHLLEGADLQVAKSNFITQSKIFAESIRRPPQAMNRNIPSH